MADPFDAYQVLQVDSDAEQEVIRAAYRRLARKYHPDLAAGPEAGSRMAAINTAWALVGTPSARAAYDRARTAPAEPRTDGTARPSGPRANAQARGPGHPAGADATAGGFDRFMGSPEGLGAARQPPGRPSGSVLDFGRYSGWSLGEIGRLDLDYLEWLDRAPIGRAYREEVDVILRAAGRRRSTSTDATDRRGLFRRR